MTDEKSTFERLQEAVENGDPLYVFSPAAMAYVNVNTESVTESSCPVCDWPYPTGGGCPWTNRHTEEDDAENG